MALAQFEKFLSKKNITWTKLDAGDRKAGSIELVKRPAKPAEPSGYKMDVDGAPRPNRRKFQTSVNHQFEPGLAVHF